jgi:N-acylneuraminate cytidylyltransferase
LRPTSPFRQASTIQRAFGEFEIEKDVDSLRAVEKCRQHPGKMWIVKGKRMTPLMPQSPGSVPTHSSQYASLPEIYAQNASLEIAWTRVVFEEHSIAGKTILPFFTEGYEGVDVNEPRDLWYVEHLIASHQATLPTIQSASIIEESRTG